MVRCTLTHARVRRCRSWWCWGRISYLTFRILFVRRRDANGRNGRSVAATSRQSSESRQAKGDRNVGMGPVHRTRRSKCGSGIPIPSGEYHTFPTQVPGGRRSQRRRGTLMSVRPSLRHRRVRASRRIFIVRTTHHSNGSERSNGRSPFVVHGASSLFFPK